MNIGGKTDDGIDIIDNRGGDHACTTSGVDASFTVHAYREVDYNRL